ncbi:MAG: NAD-dependent epimerase/dehydratase family protein [Pseudomonadota bacterium]|nr:NAD-dependent epimerase/dehydratase family protein [Pseudomonadota bacterium]
MSNPASFPSLRGPVAVTGAGGFVGRALVAQLLAQGCPDVRALMRLAPDKPVAGVSYFSDGDLTAPAPWQPALAGVDVLIHAAARAHLLKDTASDPLAEFRRVNTAGTLALAGQAAAAGVRRFVFVSSIGVNGVQTAPGRAFSEADEPHPHNAYALSKWEAEQGLLQLAAQTGLEVVIIRPPLVYGCDAPGNFGALMRAVQRGWPLPLGAVPNRRSLVSLDNLVDFILTASRHPQAPGQTFLVSDGHDLSTTELVRSMAQAAGVSARLLPVPVWLMQAGASLMGKADMVQRLCGNLQVDTSKAHSLLNWVPPVSVNEGLQRAMAEMQKR